MRTIHVETVLGVTTKILRFEAERMTEAFARVREAYPRAERQLVQLGQPIANLREPWLYTFKVRYTREPERWVPVCAEQLDLA